MSMSGIGDDKPVLEWLREQEKDYPPSSYACFYLGHFVSPTDRVCVCCLEHIPVDDPPQG
jgi:hypothetical protein